MMQAITSISHLKIKFPTPTGVGEIKGDYGVTEICYTQGLVMEETHQDNKRKTTFLRKQQSMKKHRPRTREEATKEVQFVESSPEQEGNITSPKGPASNQVTVVEKANQVPNQASSTMQETKESEQVNFYLKKNSEAQIHQMVSNKEQAKIEAEVETEEVQIDESSPNKKVKVGSGLEESFKERLASMLREYKDVFKRRNFAPERQKAIDEEVEKLLKAGIIKEIKYPEWLANIVMVKKSNDKWKICVDYTDLNDACPQDPYPLPNIDQLIGATSGHIMLSFIDAFSGYNQIKMNLKDIPKTVFITHRAVYAYVVLPFGLTSVRSTYQRAMNKIFKCQIGRNLECYIDDMISKSTTIPGHVEDLKECFDNLRKNQLKLNPEKCTFGVGASKFLGFMISNRRIEDNPEKIKEIQEMKALRTQKDVQKLAALLAALRRFVSKLEERCLPLFDLLKGSSNKKEVNWSPEYQKAFEEIKTAIKAQALADVIIECNFPEEEPQQMDMDPEPEKDTIPGAWTLKVDGSSTSERLGAGLILKSPEGFKIQTAISFGFPTRKNQVEYEALIAGLKLSRTLRVQDLKIYSDSQIVDKQTNGKYIANDPTLAKYQALVQSYLASIPNHQVFQIYREENEEAIILSKLVQNSSDLDCSVYFEELHKPSIESEEVLEIESNHNWMTPFINYLEKGELPEDKGKAQRLKAKAVKFFLEEGLLYCRTFSSFFLKCIGPEEAKYYLAEDAIEFIKKYKECQLFSNVSRISPVLPSSVLSPIPFAVWGINIMGPLSRAKGDLRYLLVSIFYGMPDSSADFNF
ncbi:uncharacterized protein LOC141685756 [Apium graveolens]|uniref:uncharacterized protein LOC141685756 n=1 Tax=Apium graveolens TaxID=4045 RepID=UPI003D7B54E5